MSERDHPELFALDIVDDAVLEPAEREAAPSSPPGRTEMGVRTEETENALELRDEGETELGVRFLGIVGRSVAELPVGLGTDGGDHLMAARARAMASAAGMSVARPLSTSSTRRSTSAAQASSISWSSKRLAISRSASRARSSAVSLSA